MRVIKDRQIVEDDWVRLAADAEFPAVGNVLVELQRWNAGLPPGHDVQVGLLLAPTDDVSSIQRLHELRLIAIDFPRFTDGRGYSLARLLRTRLGYRGELRAVGNVLRDQLLYMQRCGFDAFELDPSKNAEAALSAFDELQVYYQAASDVAEPLFRRAARGATAGKPAR